MTRLQGAGHVAQIVATMLLSVSILIALLAFIEEKSVRKERFTFEFARVYYGESLTSARMLVFDNVVRVQSIVEPGRLGGGDIGHFLSRELQNRGRNDAELASAIVRIADYYSSAAACVESELCDDVLVRELLQDEANSVNCIIGPSLLLISGWANVSGLAAGLEYFETSPC
ncbi:MAG: hypothetical protein Rhims3KO_20450 [Hyphomicrobiales bacterium]